MASDARCDKCVFWNLLGPFGGYCRKHAPVIVQNPGPTSQWPITGPDDFCGDFTPTATEPPPDPYSGIQLLE